MYAKDLLYRFGDFNEEMSLLKGDLLICSYIAVF